jgi:hypothetical protein
VPARINNGPRKNDRIQSVSLLVYDLDNKDQVITADELERKIKQQGYRAIIYSTFTHTPEKPRYRLILDISEPLPPALHKHALLHIAAKLGILEVMDKNAMDLSRFFYRPRCPADQVQNYVFREIDGVPVNIKKVSRVNSSKVVSLLDRRNGDEVTSNLAGISCWPETGDNVEQVRAMLEAVSPDCERGVWTSIIWAVLSLDWQAGEDLVTEWSKQSAVHWSDLLRANEASADLQRVIDDYSADRNPTIGTLWHHAKAGGWVQPVLASSIDIDSPPARINRFNLLSPSDLKKLSPMQWLVKGVLPAQGLAAIYGAPGSGKTFLSLDLAIAVCSGLPGWFGRQLTKRPVVYLALEGGDWYRQTDSGLGTTQQ